jgi:hypothetical protein
MVRGGVTPVTNPTPLSRICSLMGCRPCLLEDLSGTNHELFSVRVRIGSVVLRIAII